MTLVWCLKREEKGFKAREAENMCIHDFNKSGSLSAWVLVDRAVWL